MLGVGEEKGAGVKGFRVQLENKEKVFKFFFSSNGNFCSFFTFKSYVQDS